MRFAGVLPADAPDPRLASETRVNQLWFRHVRLRPQPSHERTRITAFEERTGGTGREEASVSFSYTLWRNPADRSDPVNLADLDERTLRALDEEPPWPRPGWLIEQVQQMKYPILWEAVRTTWVAESSAPAALSTRLLEHVNYVLRNQYREELGLSSGPTRSDDWKVRASAVDSHVVANVDGEQVPGVHIDIDPFVYALGFDVAPDTVSTVVLPRDALPFLVVAFETWSAAHERS